METRTFEPTLAIVSEGTFCIDGEGRPGVITVQRFEDDHIEIYVQPLGPVKVDIEVILDTNDLRHIKHFLKAQDLADVLQPSMAEPAKANRAWMDEIEQRLAALESDPIGIDLMETYDRIAMRERALMGRMMEVHDAD